MKHEINELFSYNNKIYDAQAMSKLLNVDITVLNFKERKALGCKKMLYRICDYNKPNKGSFKYNTVNGEKIAWQFGEKTFFDTEEERNQAREEYQASREESKYRNKLLAKINQLTTEELENILKNF